MTRVLAISDEVCEVLDGSRLEELRPDIVVSCGDLPFDYLEYVLTVTNVPLAWVPGNHDPERTRRAADLLLVPAVVKSAEESFGPEGATNVDGRVVDLKGVRVAGLGGSIRYSEGPHQYTETEMRRRTSRLTRRARLQRLRDGNGIDILATHSPPLGVGDDHDPAHRGFASFHRLAISLQPQVWVHGHVHPHGRRLTDHHVGATPVVNVVGYRLLEL